MFLFYQKYGNIYLKRIRSILPSVALLAFIFSVIMVVGMSIKTLGDLSFLAGNGFRVCYSMFIMTGYWIFFYIGIRVIFDRIGLLFSYIPGRESVRKVQNFIVDKHPFLGPMFMLLLAWLPYWIAFFPGSVMWDPFVQFDCYFGIYTWSDHHPVFSTILLGSLMQLGRFLWSDSMGVFLCALLQHILLSSSIAYGMYSMKKWGISAFYRLLVLLFLAFCPMIAFWPQSVMKDCFYFAFLLMNTVSVINVLYESREDANVILHAVMVVLTGILTSLLRHNGVYVVTAATLALCISQMKAKYKAVMLICALSIIMGTSAISNGLIRLTGAVPGSVREALSIPFQQTARYVDRYGDEVTEEERTAIDRVLVYENLAEVYVADDSDPVKGTYRGNDEALKEYFNVWFKMFLKHPLTYVEAFLGNTYSYFYPNGESTAKDMVYDVITYNTEVNTGYFDIKYELPLEGMRSTLHSMLYILKEIPGLGLLCHLGTYTWLLLLLMFYTIFRRQKRIMVVYVPLLLNLLVCLASPINGYLRYFLPNILMLPFVAGWTMRELRFGKNQAGGD